LFISKKQKVRLQRGIDENFLKQQQKMTMDLKQGRIEKAFVPPTTYKFGNKFANKSEGARFLKRFNPIIQLRHILLTDTDGDQSYTRQMLHQFFTDEEIEEFSDQGIKNFENAVKSMSSITHPDMNIKQFILNTIYEKRGVPPLQLYS